MLTGRWRVMVVAALGLGVLAGCGQKGPLYLPDEGGEVVTRPAGGQTQSPETAPQPSTQTPSTTTKPGDEKKSTPR
jgi:predicted small lipoprotein YifL